MSHLSYASTICDGCSQDTFERLNVIHNRAVKQINYSQTTTTDQKTLNILPLKKTTTTRPKKTNLLVHKIYYNETPQNLSDIITKAPNRYNSKKLIIPQTQPDVFKSSFSFYGSIL